VTARGSGSPEAGWRRRPLGKNILVVDVATGNASRVARGRGAIWLDRHTLLVEVS
jgi:hypothetical protein